MRKGLMLLAAATLGTAAIAAPASAQYYDGGYGYHHDWHQDRWDRGHDWHRDHWRADRERDWRWHHRDRDYGRDYGRGYYGY